KEKISGLSPETTYYFRLVVENVENPAEKGSLSEPATTSTRHPIIESPPETSHSAAFSVRVEGKVIPNSFPTNWRFEYATSREVLEKGGGSTGPEGTIGAEAGEPPEGVENPRIVEGEISGLKENSTYFVRLSVKNEFGSE